jgi:hypothetical protein
MIDSGQRWMSAGTGDHRRRGEAFAFRPSHLHTHACKYFAPTHFIAEQRQTLMGNDEQRRAMNVVEFHVGPHE